MKDAMFEALTLASQSRGQTAPNPMVGAVVLSAQNEILGRGHHVRAGLPHAEVVAIGEALKQTSDLSTAILYVTLEPCSHFGRTPPCVDLIRSANIKNVVIGTLDPNPLMNGKSLEILKAQGVHIEMSPLKAECEKLVRGFKSVIKNKRPFVTLKCATSLDGKIATSGGESQWITDEPARNLGHIERSEHDSILIGVGTILADDPQLSTRVDGKSRPIRKVILDSQLRTPHEAAIFKSGDEIFIYCDWNFPQERREKLERAGATVIVLGAPDFPFTLDAIHLNGVLEDLAVRGTQELLVEGGARVLGAFARQRLFDRVVYFIAPKIFGSESRDVFEGLDVKTLRESIVLENLSARLIGKDIVIEGMRCLPV